MKGGHGNTGYTLNGLEYGWSMAGWAFSKPPRLCLGVYSVPPSYTLTYTYNDVFLQAILSQYYCWMEDRGSVSLCRCGGGGHSVITASIWNQ